MRAAGRPDTPLLKQVPNALDSDFNHVASCVQLLAQPGGDEQLADVTLLVVTMSSLMSPFWWSSFEWFASKLFFLSSQQPGPRQRSATAHALGKVLQVCLQHFILAASAPTHYFRGCICSPVGLHLPSIF